MTSHPGNPRIAPPISYGAVKIGISLEVRLDFFTRLQSVEEKVEQILKILESQQSAQAKSFDPGQKVDLLVFGYPPSIVSERLEKQPFRSHLRL